MDLELLLAHADDKRPVLGQGIPGEAARSAAKPEIYGPKGLRWDSGDPNVLSDQRWGVIVPEGPDGDKLLGSIDALGKARAEAQGAPVKVYRVPSEMSAAEAARWKNDVYWDESVPEEDLPRYLLILGDADRVSLELQQILGADTFVGRLAFESEDAYGAYADKVLRWERQPSVEARARALYYTVHDGTAATTVGYRALMTPSIALSRERTEKGMFRAKEIVEIGEVGGGTGDSLLTEVSERSPSVLFSISHGLGPPKRGWGSDDEQRALQGALSLGGGERLAAEDLGRKPFLPGGVWFFLACYGAGTPGVSAYQHWLHGLREAGRFSGRVESVLAGLPKEGSRPFVAALPQAVLANPDGPLAVMGHVDLAWTYSFQDEGPVTRSRPSRFQGVFRSLVNGARAGVAHHELLRFFTEASVELSVMYDDEARGATTPVDAVRRAHLWMLRQDLAGYVLLGDPAVRLPLAGTATASRRPPPLTAPRVPDILGAAAAAGIVTTESAGTRDATGKEAAVLEVLGGDAPLNDIAARRNMSRADLRRWVDAYREAGRQALAKLK